MASVNNVNGNFRKIALTDANDRVTGITLSGASALKVAGGTSGQALVSDGSGGFTWGTPAGVTSTYGTAEMLTHPTVLPNNGSIGAAVTLVTFTLPAGTWDVFYTAAVQGNPTNEFAVALFTPAGAVITGSELGAWSTQTGAQGKAQISGRQIIVSTGGSYTLRGWTTFNTNSMAVITSDKGRTKAVWVKIAP